MRILMFGGTGGMGTLTSSLLKEAGHDVLALGTADADVTVPVEIEKAIVSFKPEVVLNFAVYNHDAPIHKLTDEEVEKQLDVNVKGAIHVLKAAVKFMREQNSGRIIFLSSILSAHPVHGTALYSAGKSFVDNLVRTAAVENAKLNISVNSIQLGYFEAGLINKVPKDLLDGIVAKIPQKRLGKAQELVNAIEFIINTPYFTGANLPLNGGLDISSL